MLETMRGATRGWFWLAAGLIFLSLNGCGSGDSSDSPGPAVKTGFFLDSAVDGLEYRTPTRHGLTNASGRFEYLEGEEVSFFLGDVDLGSCPGREELTPVDLVPGALDESDGRVTNICRLLLTLDEDDDPGNGIRITGNMRGHMMGRDLILDDDVEGFGGQPGVQDLLEDLNAGNAFPGGERGLASPALARNHMQQTLAGLGGKPLMDTFGDDEELLAYLKEQFAENVMPGNAYGREGALAAAAMDGQDGEGAGFTQTNVQEGGVDEPDVVKADGDTLFVAQGKSVAVVSAPAPDAMAVISRIEVDGAVESLQLYKNVLVVQYRPKGSEGRRWEGAPGDPVAMVGMPFWIPVKARTGLLFVDVLDPANPLKLRDVLMDGSAVSSRRLDSMLHVVLSFLPALPPIVIMADTPAERGMATAENREALAPVTLADLAPAYESRDGQGQLLSEGPLVLARDFHRPVEPGGGSIISVVTFNLDDLDRPARGFESIGVVADAHVVYASPTALYLCASRFTAFRNMFAVMDDQQQTLIHKFDLAGAKARFAASGRVWGRILNPFSLGEHQGVLRIATTTGWASWGWNTAANHVFCLKESEDGDKVLSIIGRLENIAPGEQLYSARFMGAQGFLVTFVNVDPLFTLDLSDPANPAIVGELKVPGFSTYLHPAPGGLLVGLGKNAISDNAGTWYQGLQVSLFDVNDFANPVRLDDELIGERGTTSEALYEHHAFTLDPQSGFLAFPVDLFEHPVPPADVWQFGQYTFSGLYVYRMDAANGFTPLGRLSTQQDPDAPAPIPPPWTRALFQGPAVYAITPTAIRAAQAADIPNTLHLLPLSPPPEAGE